MQDWAESPSIDLIMSAAPSSGNPNVPMLPTHARISLPELLEAAVQKTYHELFTMAELYVAQWSPFDLLSTDDHASLFSLQSKTILER